MATAAEFLDQQDAGEFLDAEDDAPAALDTPEAPEAPEPPEPEDKPAALDAVSDIPTANQAADALLNRNISGGSSTGRTVKQALHVLRNKSAVSGGTLTVFDTDDATSSWTAAVSQDAAAEPITGIDPA